MIRATVTEASYEPRTADASCEDDCSWSTEGVDGPTRRLARQHTNETGHTTIVYAVQRVVYTRKKIGV